MIKLIIIDDEEKVRETLEGLLSKYCPKITVVATADSVKTGIDAVKLHGPDIVLLDIQMPGGGGFEFLKQAAPFNFQLIFITAYQEHAIRAFKFSALDYLLKPVDATELQAAINRAEQAIRKEDLLSRLDVLASNLAENKINKRIVLKTFESIYVISLKDIVRCEAEGSYSRFFMKDKRKILVSRQLKEFEELFESENFSRVHKTHLVNMEFVEQYRKADGTLKLTDGTVIPVAQRKKEEVLGYLKDRL
jgi:two-component system, LytTR family, response regulator